VSSKAISRRKLIGAGAAALAAAGLGVSLVKAQFTLTLPPTEGNFPSLDGATGWLNSAPLSPPGLRGKVVLVNFWTYTCVNWLRQLPYVRAWAHKYSDLLVIGVHTPEFSFEHDIDNVRRAAADMRVEYPIAIDNDYAVWSAFSNNYWPALYFVDAMGRIRHHHFGEGAYDESERVLQQLLSDAGSADPGTDLVVPDARGLEVAADWDDLQSAESYLGQRRSTNFESSGAASPLRLNRWALEGAWTLGNEAVVLNEAGGRIVFQYHARDVNLVMGPATPGAAVGFRVLIDGAPPGAAHGFDVDDQGYGTLTEQRLHQLIRQPLPVSDRRFEIEFAGAGAAGYCFTFG
jgi:thiol-disulfide isomerase/thioredoxin